MPVLKSDAWKTLRKKHGLEKHAVKASVGSKLDTYHKAKTTSDKVKALLEVKKALIKYKTELDKKDNGPFLTDIDKIIKDVDDRTRKLGERAEAAKQLDTLTVQAVLGGGPYGKAFQTFATKTHSGENVDFMLVSAKAPKGKAAQKIYETFIELGSKREINIDGGTRQNLSDAAGRGDWANMDFKPARKEIERLIEMDTLPKFVKLMKKIENESDD